MVITSVERKRVLFIIVYATFSIGLFVLTAGVEEEDAEG